MIELGMGRPVPRAHLLDRPVNQVTVVVAEHMDGIDRHQGVHRPPCVKRPARHVAEIDDCLDALCADIRKDSRERQMISMHIGNRGKAHRVHYPGGVPLSASTWPGKIQRARDQDARRYFIGEFRQGAQRRFDASQRFRRACRTRALRLRAVPAASRWPDRGSQPQ